MDGVTDLGIDQLCREFDWEMCLVRELNAFGDGEAKFEPELGHLGRMKEFSPLLRKAQLGDLGLKMICRHGKVLVHAVLLEINDGVDEF